MNITPLLAMTGDQIFAWVIAIFVAIGLTLVVRLINQPDKASTTSEEEPEKGHNTTPWDINSLNSFNLQHNTGV